MFAALTEPAFRRDASGRLRPNDQVHVTVEHLQQREQLIDGLAVVRLISFWDALVIQAAQVAGAEILYSEDLSDGQRYGTVRVKNPLTGGE